MADRCGNKKKNIQQISIVFFFFFKYLLVSIDCIGYVLEKVNLHLKGILQSHHKLLFYYTSMLFRCPRGEPVINCTDVNAGHRTWCKQSFKLEKKCSISGSLFSIYRKVLSLFTMQASPYLSLYDATGVAVALR